jgi:hypothetical protein
MTHCTASAGNILFTSQNKTRHAQHASDCTATKTNGKHNVDTKTVSIVVYVFVCCPCLHKHRRLDLGYLPCQYETERAHALYNHSVNHTNLSVQNHIQQLLPCYLVRPLQNTCRETIAVGQTQQYHRGTVIVAKPARPCVPAAFDVAHMRHAEFICVQYKPSTGQLL